MNQYVNAFHTATKLDGSEFILQLCQNAPVLDDKGAITTENIEVVGSFVMSHSFAKEMASAILETLAPRETDPIANANE